VRAGTPGRPALRAGRPEDLRCARARLKACATTKLRYNETRYNETRYNETRYNETRYNETRHDGTRHDGTRHDGSAGL
jgi:hypothetical protein